MAASAHFRFGPIVHEDAVEFRLWAPEAKDLSVEIECGASAPLKPTRDGWHCATVKAGNGTRYRFCLANEIRVPDPASRFQPEGIDGPSQIVADDYRWRHETWRGRPWREVVLYEIHAGVAGGYAGVGARLQALRGLGVTAVEMMPLAEFPGARSWGYDGVLPFAPSRAYGTPDELKSLVDQAHGLGLMMFLDVVYNHFGPQGNYLAQYASQFFRDDIETPWGAAIDFRQPEVRQFYIQNALYWLGEFRFDGLRLDAVHAISDQDWIAEMASAVRAAFPDRHIHLVLENENNLAEHMRNGIDAQWNDDFHNAMHVLLTGETMAYYSAFADRPIEGLARSLAEGFIYQGEPSPHHGGAARGTPSADLPPTAFVNFLQNHDQVGNRALGERLAVLTDPQSLKAAIALLLLAPPIPLIFMGEENGARTPFLFFTDFCGDLADAVREGRRREFTAFPAFADPEQCDAIPDPNALATFSACGLRSEADSGAWRAYYRALLTVRHVSIVPLLDDLRAVDATVIGPKAVLARWRAGRRRLTIACNLDQRSIKTALPDAPPIWGGANRHELGGRSTIAWLTTGGLE
jgi:maltooligosyltrehalose trehalohydrolase